MKIVPTRFPPHPARLAAESRHRETVVRAKRFRRPRGHRHRALRADRAMLQQQTFGYIQKLHTRVVRTADDAAGEEFARARDLVERVREQPARSRLRHREAFLLRAQQVAHDFRERIVPVTGQILAEQPSAFARRDFELRRRQRPARRTHAAIDHPLMRAKRHVQGFAIPVENRLQLRLERRFPNPRRADLHIGLATKQQPARRQSRQNLIDKHRVHLVRRPRQHAEHAAVLLDPQTRRRSVGIRQHLPALEAIRLLEIVRGHLPPKRRKAVRDRALDLRIEHQLLPQHRREHLTGAIVARRPQTAGRDQHVRTRPTLAKLPRDRVGVIGDRHVARERHAPPAQLLPDEGQMRVRRQTEQQLVAQRQQFIVHLLHRLRRWAGVDG